MGAMCYVYVRSLRHPLVAAAPYADDRAADRPTQPLLLRWIRYLPVLSYPFFFLLTGTSYTTSYGFAKFLTGFNPTTKNSYKLN